MGKGKGKAGKRDEKLAVRVARREERKAQLALLPPGAKLPKVPKKSKIAKPQKPNLNPPGPATFPIPTGRPKPFVKSPQGAKWPSMFKKHLGVIEAHVRKLTSVAQAMQADMGKMSSEERDLLIKGSRGNWLVILGLLGRTREILTSARIAAKGILPSRSLRDKKGLGVLGGDYIPEDMKAAVLGGPNMEPLGAGRKGMQQVETDSDGDTSMSDDSDDSDDSGDSVESSDSSNDEDSVRGGADFVPLNGAAEKPRSSRGSKGGDVLTNGTSTGASAVEPNPYFVVDTKPTPVIVNGHESFSKKGKKRSKEDDTPDKKKAKKARKQDVAVAETEQDKELEMEKDLEEQRVNEEKVNFQAVEAQLQAEVEAGMKAKAEAAQDEPAPLGDDGSKKDKKRRRSSTDGDASSKKHKKDKKEKRKADDNEDGASKKRKKHKEVEAA